MGSELAAIALEKSYLPMKSVPILADCGFKGNLTQKSASWIKIVFVRIWEMSKKGINKY